jgi:hypothetical protein
MVTTGFKEFLGHGFTQMNTDKKKKLKCFRFIRENPCNLCYPCSMVLMGHGFTRKTRIRKNKAGNREYQKARGRRMVN